MVRLISPFLSLAIVVPVLGLEVTVSPNSPIASLSAARDAVREARRNGDQSPARVVIRDGIYELKEAVVFEPQDSGVAYEAAAGARPLFSGGKQITGWKVGEGGLWTAHVDPNWRFEALWINGRRVTRARTPNQGFVQALGQPSEAIEGVKATGDLSKTTLKIDPEIVKTLATLTPEELRDVNTVVYFSWDEQRHRIAGVRAADGALQFTGPLHRAFFSLEPYHNVHLENYRAALDAPGEWFLARDGTLLYQPLPGEKLESIDAWAPFATRWLVIRGDAEKEAPVHDLQFRGLRFAHQGWSLPDGGAAYGQAEASLGAAIEADGARDIQFINCELTHTLTNAAWFRHGCTDVLVEHCHIHDLGAGGIKIGEVSAAKDPRGQTARVRVENSIIQSGGRYFPGCIGVWIGRNGDNTIRHCDIGDFYYTAISIGWTWGYEPTPCARNAVEFCHLHHLGWGVMSDMGAVYTLGPQPGTVIRGCHVHDIACSSYGGWGLYNDEGSTGIVWENNLVHHTQSGGYHQHYGRGNVIRNNIFAFSQEMQIRRSRPEDFLAFTFEQNIVLFDEGKLFGHVDTNWFDGRVSLSRNVYWRRDGQPIDCAGKTWEDWQLWGNDTESVIANPLFNAPDQGDWTLKPESPALKLGFKPFDWRQAGVTGDEAWRKLAAIELPVMKFAEKPKPVPLSVNDGFEATPLGAKPRQAVANGKPDGIIQVVAELPSRGVHCLQMSDSPDITPVFEPHFYYHPNHANGVTHVAFDVRLEPAFHLIHEWRDDAQPYRSGPMLDFRDGAVFANGRKLVDLPPAGWLHVEIVARIGSDSDGTWTCKLTPEGDPAQEFADLKFVKPEMGELKWLGFAGVGKEVAKCWLDEIVVENRKP